MVAGGAHAASATFDFNLPAVGSNAVRPPYPTVATLTLVDVAGGVQFTLDPNETSSGFAGDASSEFVERLTLAYRGAEPVSFSNVAGAAGSTSRTAPGIDASTREEVLDITRSAIERWLTATTTN